MLGTGIAKGEERAILAAQQAINSPLLQDVSIRGAQGILINITGPENLTVHEINDASQIIYEEAGTEANIIPGCVIDKTLEDELRITVIATGLNEERKASIATNIQHEEPLVKLDYNQPKASTELNSDIPETTPMYQRKQMEQVTEKVDTNTENDDMLMFSDDLEVPAFIRNRHS